MVADLPLYWVAMWWLARTCSAGLRSPLQLLKHNQFEYHGPAAPPGLVFPPWGPSPFSPWDKFPLGPLDPGEPQALPAPRSLVGGGMPPGSPTLVS